MLLVLPDWHHRFQHPTPGLPQSEHEPAKRRAAGAEHGRGFFQGPTTGPH